MIYISARTTDMGRRVYVSRSTLDDRMKGSTPFRPTICNNKRKSRQMLKVEVRVYDDVKRTTRDEYGDSQQSSQREKVVDFTTVAIDAERLVLTTATMMCVALDVDFVHDGENFAFGKDRAHASR